MAFNYLKDTYADVGGGGGYGTDSVVAVKIVAVAGCVIAVGSAGGCDPPGGGGGTCSGCGHASNDCRCDYWEPIGC